MDQAGLLIIGANGQLGLALQAKYPDAGAVDSNSLDITSRQQLTDFDWSNIKTIINAAAYTNVDGAETADGRVSAWKINASGAANLAQIASLNDITLVHISSDYVFDGTQNPHTENEAFSPLGVYGQSKAAGDIAVALAPKHYILRATWVIGEGKNFVGIMLDLGQRGIAPTVVSDQIGRLTFTSELTNIIDHLVTTGAAYGTYDATNRGEPASWADITRLIFKTAGFDLAVTDTSTTDYFKEKPDAAPRPLNSIMDLSKLQATGFASTDWHDELQRYIKTQTP